jgi:hypothetical protein
MKIDSFTKCEGQYIIEFDGWHFEGVTPLEVINKVLSYIKDNFEELNK